MTCLIVAASLLRLKIEDSPFTFWSQKSTSKSFEIKAVSPDGSLCLCLSAGEYWLISKDGETDLKVFRNKTALPVAISNDGQILVNTYDEIDRRNGPGLRGAIVSGDNVTLLGVDSSAGWIPFQAGGFEKDGRVLGVSSLRVGSDAVSTLIELTGFGARRFESQSIPFGPLLMGQSSDGLIGVLVRPYLYLNNGRSQHGEDMQRAILIRGDRARDMELPAGFKGSRPTAWTSDGPYVAGELFGDHPCSVIWKSGEIYAYPSEDTKHVAFTPRSITHDGTVVVGNIGYGLPRTAVIWTEKGGTQSLLAYLSNLKLEIPKDLSFVEAAHVSADGSTIIATVQAKDQKRSLVRIVLPKSQSKENGG